MTKAYRIPGSDAALRWMFAGLGDLSDGLDWKPDPDWSPARMPDDWTVI